MKEKENDNAAVSENRQDGALDQNTACTIAKLLSGIVNNSTLYGHNHPSTHKSAEALADLFSGIAASYRQIALVKNGNSFYIEKICVDKRLNVARFSNLFSKPQIESIAFQPGLLKEHLLHFIEIFMSMTWPDAEAKNKELANRGVTTVKFNFVYYQQVTQNDVVVNRDTIHIMASAVAAGQHATATPHAHPQVQQQPAAQTSLQHQPQSGQGQECGSRGTDDSTNDMMVMTLEKLLQQPVQVAQNILMQAHRQTPDPTFIQKQFLSLTQQLQSGATLNEKNLDMIVEAVSRLNTELNQNLQLQKSMGTLGKEQSQILSEAEKLTFQTIITLVRQEYKHGAISVKRLGAIIRRMVPDVNNLGKLLPLLKEGLCADGMSLPDFVSLTQELEKELHHDKVGQILTESGKQIGLSIDELVETIAQSPGEAARLIVLAAELKQKSGDQIADLSVILSDYVNKIGYGIAAKSVTADSADSVRQLQATIDKVHSDLLTKLSTEQTAKPLLTDIQTHLKKQSRQTLASMVLQQVNATLDNNGQVLPAQLTTLLKQYVPTKEIFSCVRQNLATVLTERGFSTDEIKQLFGRLEQGFTQKVLSASVEKYYMNSANLLYFMNRYVLENVRYGNPFSCISLSFIQHNRSGGPWTETDSEMMRSVATVLGPATKKALRVLDIMGLWGKLMDKGVGIILPMTDKIGANIVRSRLRSVLIVTEYSKDFTDIDFDVVISCLTFDKEKTPDCKSFCALITQTHAQELADLLKRKTETSTPG
ncbi:MAG: hypothetical protein JW795_10015 [Chitinivibrionales bacterium]|nr:hypothetical protein [Chitinivibrionales bacterium]